MFTNVSPTCSPCGHVMQPVGDRTLWERKIGGAAASFWFGREYECVSCRTRTVLVDGKPVTPGSVGYELVASTVEPLQTIPAKRVVWAEHLPADVRRDTCRMGGTRHLSQRQQAASLVEDFFAKDDAAPIETLLRLAELFDLDVEALTNRKAESIVASVDVSDHAVNERPTARRDANGAPLELVRWENWPETEGQEAR